MKNSGETTYVSFFILGGLWVLQFVLMLIMKISRQDFGDATYGDIFVGIVHAVVLCVAAYEDLRFGTSHLKWVIILSVVMNFLLGFLATMGIVLLIAGLAVVCILSTGAGLGAFVGIAAAGGGFGTAIMILLFIGTIIGSMFTMSGGW